MDISALTLGLLGFGFCTAFRNTVDRLLLRLWHCAADWLRRAKSKSHPRQEELALVSRLIASTRAGISLDAALASVAADPAIGKWASNSAKRILAGRPPKDFFSTFLEGALRSGVPVVGTLQIFQKTLQADRRARIKADSLTGQARAQAEVLSWLPWVLCGSVALVDGEWFSAASRSGEAWACWGMALLLIGGGRQWIRFLLQRALHPGSQEERFQEGLLPELTLRLLSHLSLGKDAETAWEASLAECSSFPEAACLRAGETPVAVAPLQGILHHASRTGATLREDLLAFLADLHLQTEGRWEERVQRLPILMMAPLFLCFFPASLLMLAALLLPMARDLL